MRAKPLRPSIVQRGAGAAFLAPSLIGLAIFFVAPFVDVARRSFTNTSGERFVGLDNYATVLGNDAFALAAGNTARFMLVCIPLLLALSLAIAVALRKATPFRRFMKASLLVPLAIPAFTAALLIDVFFNAEGIVNGMLSALGGEAAAWLSGDAALFVLVADYVWRNLGYCVILWLAALSGIPANLYEAARIDGAGVWLTARRITLPLVAPSCFVVATLAVINAFKVYREAYLVAGSYPPESIYLVGHVFNNWFASLSVGKLAAGGVLLSLVLLAVVGLLFRAWGKQGGGRR